MEIEHIAGPATFRALQARRIKQEAGRGEYLLYGDDLPSHRQQNQARRVLLAVRNCDARQLVEKWSTTAQPMPPGEIAAHS